MQRYFLEEIVQDKEHIQLSGDYFHHMVRVMRMKVGQEVVLVSPNQEAFIAQISGIDKEALSLQWVADILGRPELPVEVTIACGLPKNDKLDWLIQKATELGAHYFQPFQTKWSMVKWEDKKQDKKIQRLQKIAQEAAEQSHRVCLPRVKPFQSFKELLATFSDYTHILVAYEESAKAAEVSQLKQLVQSLKPGDKVLAIFGSEGGLSPEEVEAFVLAGATPCGLGPRIMRAETAPLYLLSALSYALELGGETCN